jgi:hypothetical protein
MTIKKRVEDLERQVSPDDRPLSLADALVTARGRPRPPAEALSPGLMRARVERMAAKGLIVAS